MASESMKNKSKMWGGDKASATSKTKAAAKSAASKTTNTTKAAGKKTASTKSSSGSTKSSAKSSTAKSASSDGKSAKKATGGKKMNKTEFAQDMTALNDVEIISDVLTSHKGLVKLYGTALCESSCENMRELVAQHLTECGEDQFDVFLYMSERNLYPTEEAPAQKLTTAKNKFKQYEQKMKQ